jgi:hypothetical protein
MKAIVAISTKRPQMWENVIENLSRQSLKPDHVVMGVHRVTDKPLNIERWCNENNIPFYCKSFPESMAHVSVESEIVTKASELSDNEDGLIFQWDDDDWYGVGFLQEAIASYGAVPDAAIIGKSWYRVRWMGSEREIVDEGYTGIDPLSMTDWVAGPTIGISIKSYLQNASFRHSTEFYQIDVAILRPAASLGLPFYTTSPTNFVLQRYPNPDHEHKWKRPYEG